MHLGSYWWKMQWLCLQDIATLFSICVAIWCVCGANCSQVLDKLFQYGEKGGCCKEGECERGSREIWLKICHVNFGQCHITGWCLCSMTFLPFHITETLHGSIHLNKNFLPAYYDRDSLEFQKLAQNFTLAVSIMFSCFCSSISQVLMVLYIIVTTNTYIQYSDLSWRQTPHTPLQRSIASWATQCTFS